MASKYENVPLWEIAIATTCENEMEQIDTRTHDVIYVFWVNKILLFEWMVLSVYESVVMTMCTRWARGRHVEASQTEK